MENIDHMREAKDDKEISKELHGPDCDCDFCLQTINNFSNRDQLQIRVDRLLNQIIRLSDQVYSQQREIDSLMKNVFILQASIREISA